jgi:uncharacterized protein involved in exopolysaccharide biosynthesis
MTLSPIAGPLNQWPALQILWLKRLFLIKVTLTGWFLGLLVAFALPIRYTSKTRLLPELEDSQAFNLKSFQQLAESFGLDFDARPNVEAIRPDLYPEILQSTPFLLSVLHQNVQPRQQSSLPLYKFLNQADWSFTNDSIGSLPKSDAKPLRLTTTQQDLLTDVKSRIQAKLDIRSGIISISAEMPDPEVAQQIAQFASDYLKDHVQYYRNQKARADEQFLLGLLTRAEQEAHRLEERLLKQQDQTRFVSLPSASLVNRRLIERYEQTKTLYDELKRQHTQAQIQVQTVTPVFSVLEPVQVPDRRSSPRRFWIVLAGMVSGLALGALWAIGRRALLLPV